MPFSAIRLRRTILGIAPHETDFGKRGFHFHNSATQARLEQSAATFVLGYHAALESEDNASLTRQLEHIEHDFRGFAYEGAGMGLSLLDFFSPWQKRFPAFVQHEGDAHIYMLYVGWGWSMGRLPRKHIPDRAPYDPVLRWLAYDGYGFHEGFFSWQKSFLQRKQPSYVHGYARRAFDQGLGRSLWFVGGGDVDYITDVISAFPAARQPDLWSGIGLASSYAGGVATNAIEHIRIASADMLPHLAQGSAFALKARQRAGNLGENTRLVSQIYCALPVDDIIQVVDTSRQNLPMDQSEPAFEIWRHRIRQSLAIPVAK